MVLKSSEISPRSQSVVAELFEEAGLPPGVLNFINVSRENAPSLTAEIIAHPAVRTISVSKPIKRSLCKSWTILNYRSSPGVIVSGR